jgi:hypothetical protein
MNAIVCTLFENHHHYGLGALTNSLYRSGFRGSIFAGYRGKLPPWSINAKQNLLLNWEGANTYEVAAGLVIHFLPVDTTYHFTNFKPNFMLQVLEGPAKHAEAIAYFDPDITIKCKWQFFESWMAHGVALVHDGLFNDMPPTHPKRKIWENVIHDCNRKVTRNLYSYINGGFCGVLRSNDEFLRLWIEIFDRAVKEGNVTPEKWRHSPDPNYMFFSQDQDLLNITAMCCESPISEIGPEAMDFLPGGFIMAHSIGYLKPWTKRFVRLAFKGRAPSSADKIYWRNVEAPVSLFSKSYIKRKRLSLTIASFIGRLYRRT